MRVSKNDRVRLQFLELPEPIETAIDHDSSAAMPNE